MTLEKYSHAWIICLSILCIIVDIQTFSSVSLGVMLISHVLLLLAGLNGYFREELDKFIDDDIE